MAFEIKPATRSGILPLVGLFGKSGSGKTLSALKLARGIVGSRGRIVLIDSESRRGSLFADLIPGGYSVIDLDPPFTPDRYLQAVTTAETSADVLVVDSLTHEWAGEGGVLDMAEAELDRMAGNDFAKRERVKMASWIRPKQEHKQFIQRLLRLKCGLVVCLRGEEKTHMVKGEEGKKSTVVTDEFSTPIFDSRFLFELLVCLETVAHEGKGGYVIPRKITHPSLGQLLPDRNEQVTEAHGEAMVKWCGNPNRTVKVENPDANRLKKELWHVTIGLHKGSKQALVQWLWDENILSDTEHLDSLADTRWTKVVEDAKAKLKAQSP